MYEVSTRAMPWPTLLCVKRHVDEQGAWAFGKEFIGIRRDRPLNGRPRRCHVLHLLGAGQCGQLMLRVEPAHQEAFVALTTGPEGTPPAEFQLASEALRAWAEDDGTKPEQLDLGPDDLGVRITYLATPPITSTSVPDCDFAVPFAVRVG
jgi:hypothetical protein